jgi:dihydropteroate synthase
MHEWHLPGRILQIGNRPLIMGIVNVTPDSFSDGGRHAATDAAIAHGLKLWEEGADILDIGGESTRPGAAPVSEEEELARVVPVVKGLAARGSIPVSVDTSKAEVARQSLGAGAAIVNDVTALRGDPAMPEVVRQYAAAAILMHMQGTPATMQNDPVYSDVVADLMAFFEKRLQELTSLGIARECLALDPGIGFGKKVAHNVAILARLKTFQGFGRPVCLGVSRKGFLGRMLDRPVDQRLAGSLAAIGCAMGQDAVQLVRVHDVRETKDLVTVYTTISASAP